MCDTQVFIVCMCYILLALCIYVGVMLCGFVLCVVPCVLSVVCNGLCGLCLCALSVYVCVIIVCVTCLCIYVLRMLASECVSLFSCFVCDVFCAVCVGHVNACCILCLCLCVSALGVYELLDFYYFYVLCVCACQRTAYGSHFSFITWSLGI